MMPCVKYFCKNGYTTMIGTEVKTTPAICWVLVGTVTSTAASVLRLSTSRSTTCSVRSSGRLT